MKLLAGHAEQQAQQDRPVPKTMRMQMLDHTVRIAQLTLLSVTAKIRFRRNRDALLDSMHEQRTAGLMNILGCQDRRRKGA